MGYRNYTEEVIEELLLRLSNGESMNQISKDIRMPCRQTVSNWKQQNEVFALKLILALEVGNLARVEMIEERRNSDAQKVLANLRNKRHYSKMSAEKRLLRLKQNRQRRRLLPPPNAEQKTERNNREKQRRRENGQAFKLSQAKNSLARSCGVAYKDVPNDLADAKIAQMETLREVRNKCAQNIDPQRLAERRRKWREQQHASARRHTGSLPGSNTRASA